MKQVKIDRFENAIIDLVGDVVPENISVFVGTRAALWSTDEPDQVILFTADSCGTSKEKNKITKKLVKAFLEIAEEEVTVVKITKNEVILEAGSLELMFPKAGRLTQAERVSLGKTLDLLEEVSDNLYDIQYSNTKVDKILNKINDLRDKLEDLA